MRFLCLTLILSIFLNENTSTIINYYDSIDKCDFTESLEVIGCVSPILNLLENVNVQNMTRARALRIVNQCQNVSLCFSHIKCAIDMKLDKTADLLCSAIHYFSADFVKCQRNITRRASPCLRDIENRAKDLSSFFESCDTLNNSTKCFKEEIVEMCGVRYWDPIKQFLSKLMILGNSECKLDVFKQF